MQSKTSFFNGTIFKKNLTRYWPLWGMASFGGALFPLAMLVNLLHGYRAFQMKPLEMREIYFNVLTYAVPVISIVYAILCALAVWGYLYNARSVGMMHTLPVKRDSLFVTNVLSGLTMMAIPYAVTGILAVLVSLAAGSFDGFGTLVTIGGVICDSVCFFGLATLCAMVVGNVVALPAVYALLNFIAVLTDATINLLAQGFIFGLNGSYSGQFEWLSPVVYLMKKVCADCEYEQIKEMNNIEQYYYTSKLTSVTLENGYILAIYGAVGVALLVAAYFLYRNRRSESAGDVVSVKALKPVFRYGVAFYAAMLGGRLLYALFVESYDYSDVLRVAPLSVCMFVAGAIGYYAASMLLAKSARVFTKKSLIGLAAVAVGCVAMCITMGYDLLGISRRVPTADSIETLTVYVADNNYNLRGGQDEELIEAVRKMHQTLVNQQKRAQQNRNDRYFETNGKVAFAYLTLDYQLKSGLHVQRRYNLYLSEDVMALDPDSYDAAIDELVNSPAMRQRRIHADDGAKVTGGWVNSYNGNGFDLNEREAQALLDALKQDAAEGTWGTYDWFDRDYEMAYAVDLDLEFQIVDSDGRTHYDYINIVIWPEMKHLTSKLLELGLIKSEDLISRHEYDERFNWGYYDKDPEVEAKLNAYSEAAIEPVIGGAYATTSVVVG